MIVKYLTIEREYGSGGTAIAREVAKQCSMGCYGREIMEKVAQRQHISVRALEDYEERVSGSLLYSMYVMTQSQTGDPDLLSQEAKLYVAEARIIRELARSGPGVFVGHCAAKALENELGVLRVFIRSGEEAKLRRIREEYGIAPEEALATARRFDRRRANYYHFCTRQKWSDPENYDMVLDSSVLGIDGCVKALAAVCRR